MTHNITIHRTSGKLRLPTSGDFQRWALVVVRILKIVLIVVASVTWIEAVQGGTVITRDQLVEMFHGIAKDAKWDMSKPMLWGYFFTDADRSRLERVAPLLQKERNQLLYQFADEHKLGSYDGMDVGPVEAKH